MTLTSKATLQTVAGGKVLAARRPEELGLSLLRLKFTKRLPDAGSASMSPAVKGRGLHSL